MEPITGGTDDNLRLLVPLDDGLAVESVYYGSGTLCLSTQAGCAVGCPFCASGARGLRRNLTLAELERQVTLAEARGLNPLRLTLSGIGEPLQNFSVVRAFLDGSPRPVSLTTTGGPLKHLAEVFTLPHNGLMLSLHAGTPDLHRHLIPGAPNLIDLVALVSRSLAGLSRRRRRRFGVNYLLLSGVNDGAEELDRLLAVLKAWPEATLHLLACNPVPGSPFASPPPAGIDAVYLYLAGRHPQVRRPNPWRQRAEGGCGTLVVHAQAKDNNPPPADLVSLPLQTA